MANNLYLPRAVAGMQTQVLIREWYACGSINKPQMCNDDGDHNARQGHCSTIGLTSLKAKQHEAISKFLSCTRCIKLLGMKSLCYALLPLIFDYLRRIDHGSIVVCVSPLTSLIMEQSEKFTTQGVSSVFVDELQQDIDSYKSQ